MGQQLTFACNICDVVFWRNWSPV